MKSIIGYRGIEEIISKTSLEEKLKTNKQLTVKFGADPSRPDIHMGHAVVLRLLRRFQEAGHNVIFLIGDYTARIGDPSGRKSGRPILSEDEIKKNSETYFEQVGQIIDLKKTQIRYNSEWYEKLAFADLLKLTSLFTVSGIIERADFEKRLKAGQDVGLQELLYPVMQAYDSVILKADVEIGGTDQKFNLLAGRELQKKVGQSPQNIITCKLLVGLDGREKMSKSADNYIAFNDSAEEMFGKVMSLPDEQIINYYQLATELLDSEIEAITGKLKDGFNPRDLKFNLAKEITALFHNSKKADQAGKRFNQIHQKHQIPTDIDVVKLEGEYDILALLGKLNLISSNNEGRRLVEQAGIKIDGATITEVSGKVKTYPGMVVQVGKRKFIKIK